ncbi:hypothetical protein MRY87_11320 [bacterium]|nr:hypothetical protein [bacterium]
MMQQQQGEEGRFGVPKRNAETGLYDSLLPELPREQKHPLSERVPAFEAGSVSERILASIQQWGRDIPLRCSSTLVEDKKAANRHGLRDQPHSFTTPESTLELILPHRLLGSVITLRAIVTGETEDVKSRFREKAPPHLRLETGNGARSMPKWSRTGASNMLGGFILEPRTKCETSFSHLLEGIFRGAYLMKGPEHGAQNVSNGLTRDQFGSILDAPQYGLGTRDYSDSPQFITSMLTEPVSDLFEQRREAPVAGRKKERFRFELKAGSLRRTTRMSFTVDLPEKLDTDTPLPTRICATKGPSQEVTFQRHLHSKVAAAYFGCGLAYGAVIALYGKSAWIPPWKSQ